jgi:hypothetical protein
MVNNNKPSNNITININNNGSNSNESKDKRNSVTQTGQKKDITGSKKSGKVKEKSILKK